MVGGGRRDRTDDLLLAKQPLSQLSYAPISRKWWAREDLNLRPHAYQACALTNWATSPVESLQNSGIFRWWLLFVNFENNPKFLLERRWSSHTFRYGYLVTTSPQSLTLPWPTASLRLAHHLWVKPTSMVWRAVCTRPGNVFTVACWSTITSDSNFMNSSCRVQSELRQIFEVS